MDMSVLARKMLEWEELKIKLDGIEAEIKEVVLEFGKTQTVGNVRASYSGGRKMYAYSDAIDFALEYGHIDGAALKPFEKVSIDHRSACKELGIDAPFTKSEPKVTVKLI